MRMQIGLRLAEKGMCFVTKRISKLKWEPELQRKEVAVQARKGHMYSEIRTLVMA